MPSWNWDDLRFVAVLAETGTVAEAARRLNVNRTTVQRRITAFEEQLNYRLFSRDGWGLEPLPEATPILDAARQIGESLSAIERKTTGASTLVSGDLSFTTTDSIFLSGVGEIIGRFHQLHPAIRLQISITTSPLSFDQREAEVAVRPSLAPPEHLVGRRICDLTFRAYASADYIAARGFRKAEDHAWIGMLDRFSGAPTEVWLAEHVPAAKVEMRADSYVAIAEAARNGLGIALLPTVFGDRHPDLQRMENILKEPIATGIWVLTHPDFRQSPRVRVLMDFLVAELSAIQPMLQS